MIDISRDVLSLTDFKRRSAELLRRMKRSRRPMFLTVNGKAELVVQDAASYQKLLEIIDRLEAIEGIRRGLEDFKAGRVIPAEEVFAELEAKYGLQD
jgi:prevent-host-death family protein